MNRKFSIMDFPYVDKLRDNCKNIANISIDREGYDMFGEKFISNKISDNKISMLLGYYSGLITVKYEVYLSNTINMVEEINISLELCNMLEDLETTSIAMDKFRADIINEYLDRLPNEYRFTPIHQEYMRVLNKTIDANPQYIELSSKYNIIRKDVLVYMNENNIDNLMCTDNSYKFVRRIVNE